jgi:hypothetical protein
VPLLLARSMPARVRSLRHTLLFGHRRYDIDNGLLENAGAVEVLFGIGLEAYAVALQRS